LTIHVHPVVFNRREVTLGTCGMGIAPQGYLTSTLQMSEGFGVKTSEGEVVVLYHVYVCPLHPASGGKNQR